MSTRNNQDLSRKFQLSTNFIKNCATCETYIVTGMSIMSQSERKLMTNPANLRWKYLLEDLRDEEVNPKLKQKIESCIDSLAKFPLVIL